MSIGGRMRRPYITRHKWAQALAGLDEYRCAKCGVGPFRYSSKQMWNAGRSECPGWMKRLENQIADPGG